MKIHANKNRRLAPEKNKNKQGEQKSTSVPSRQSAI